MAKQPITDKDVELARVIENARTARWLIVGLVICVAVFCGFRALPLILDRPPYQIIIGTVAAAIIAPSAFMVFLTKAFTRFVARYSRRSRSLEQRIDPNRSSSEAGSPAAPEVGREKESNE